MSDLKDSELARLIQVEIQCIDTLIETLHEERAVLSGRHFQALEKLSEQKEQLAQTIEQSAAQRLQLMNMHLFNNDARTALQSYLSNCTEEQAQYIRQLNEELAAKLGECNTLNLINGQIITASINTRQELISALTGQMPNEFSTIYDSMGGIKTNSESVRHQEA